MGVTEAPWKFHIMAALAALGAVFGRRLEMPHADYTIYAPMHVLWVGPPGCGKTQAMNIVLDVIRAARPKMDVIKNQTTSVGILTRVGQSKYAIDAQRVEGKVIPDSEFILAAGEMTSLVNRKKENEDLMQMLLDMLDLPSEYEKTTGARGVDYIYRPTPTALLASAIEMLREYAPRVVFEGGFMSRIVPVVAMGKARAIHKPKLYTLQERTRMGVELWRVAERVGRKVFDLQGEAEAWYAEWYGEIHGGPPLDRRLLGWQARVHAHLLRTSMLLCVARGGEEIEVEDLVLAARVMDTVRPGLEELLQNVGGSGFGQLRQQVEAIVRHAGTRGVPRHKVLQMVPASWEEIDSVVETLKQAGIVEIVAGTKSEPDVTITLKRKERT